MSQFVNSQLSPVNLFLDSQQANFLSEDGSTATFDLAGNDLELAHSEARTAAVSLTQFHAANTIYNIDSSCNVLELYTQFTNKENVLQENKSVLVTIPIGYYNLTNLLSVLNQYIFFAFDPTYATDTRPDDSIMQYFPGFGDPYSANEQTPAIAIDTHVTGQQIGNIVSSTVVTDSTFYKTYKIKFMTPPLDKLLHGNNQSSHHYYGFYVITSNHSGLAAKLGFPASQSYTLPIKASNVVNPKGFGISLTKSISSTNMVSYSVQNPNSNVFNDTQQLFHWAPSTGTPPQYRTVGSLLAYSWLDLDSPRSIYVTIDSIITRNRSSNPKLPFGTIFARIPTGSIAGTATGFGQIILYEPTVSHEVFVPGLNLDQITIRLFDEYGKSIHWNGGHWSMTLSVLHNIDVGSAGIEDSTLGRTFRPYLHGTDHDALQTQHEFHHKKMRRR